MSDYLRVTTYFLSGDSFEVTALNHTIKSAMVKIVALMISKVLMLLLTMIMALMNRVVSPTLNTVFKDFDLTCSATTVIAGKNVSDRVAI